MFEGNIEFFRCFDFLFIGNSLSRPAIDEESEINENEAVKNVSSGIIDGENSQLLSVDANLDESVSVLAVADANLTKNTADKGSVGNIVKDVSPIGRQQRVSKTCIKRKMGYMADLNLLFGKKTDKLFTKNREKISNKIKKMNHATRFWLACKFLRLNKLDFEDDSKMRVKFSAAEICELLGVGRGSILNFVSKLNVDVSLKETLESKRYLSPVECNPKKHEIFFKKFASNYESLKVGGFFRTKNKII